MGEVTDKFQEFKSWYQSKTIIGIIISSVSGVVFAVSNGTVDVSGAVNETLSGAETLAGELDNVWASVTFVIGQAVAIWGRISAKAGIKK